MTPQKTKHAEEIEDTDFAYARNNFDGSFNSLVFTYDDT